MVAASASTAPPTGSDLIASAQANLSAAAADLSALATSPAPTVTVTETATPSSTPTPSPSLSPTPSSTPSPTPSPTLTSSTAGLLPGVALTTVTGDVKVTAAGTVLANEHITGNLTIDAPAANVTVTNVQVDGKVNINTDTPSSGTAGIIPTSIVLRHVDAHGMSAVGFDGLTVDLSRFHDNKGTLSQLARYNANGRDWPARNLTITGTVYERLLAVPAGSGYHVEDLHLMGVQGFTLAGDVFDATAPDQATWLQTTAALTLERGWEGVANTGTVTGSTFRGGSYFQAYLWGVTAFAGNAFVTAVSPDGQHRSTPMYPAAAYGSPLPAFTQSGNTLDGAPYTIPN